MIFRTVLVWNSLSSQHNDFFPSFLKSYLKSKCILHHVWSQKSTNAIPLHPKQHKNFKSRYKGKKVKGKEEYTSKKEGEREELRKGKARRSGRTLLCVCVHVHRSLYLWCVHLLFMLIQLLTIHRWQYLATQGKQQPQTPIWLSLLSWLLSKRKRETQTIPFTIFMWNKAWKQGYSINKLLEHAELSSLHPSVTITMAASLSIRSVPDSATHT